MAEAYKHLARAGPRGNTVQWHRLRQEGGGLREAGWWGEVSGWRRGHGGKRKVNGRRRGRYVLISASPHPLLPQASTSGQDWRQPTQDSPAGEYIPLCGAACTPPLHHQRGSLWGSTSSCLYGNPSRCHSLCEERQPEVPLATSQYVLRSNLNPILFPRI